MTVLLLDGHNLLFRSFTSLPRSITDRQGEPINALYGMLAAIVRLARDIQPRHIVAAFDVPETPTFRHELYPSYQAQRGPLGGEHADEFRRQVKLATEALPKLGVPAITCPGYEADDVMGTLARRAAESGLHAILVTTDRDLLQLVSPGIGVLPPNQTSSLIGAADEVRERIGVLPEYVPTFKALAGDASDNIPGVAGVGSKTAAVLVDEYGDLDGIYQHLGEIRARTAAALETHRERAYLFRRLATIVTELDLPVRVRDLPPPELSGDSKVGELLVRLGYRSGTPGGTRTPGL
jgi:DNA polymerase-1